MLRRNFQNKQTEVFQPIMTKVDKAIKDVGKENGFVYVFDVAKGAVALFR
jgi:outer membrane protein